MKIPMSARIAATIAIVACATGDVTSPGAPQLDCTLPDQFGNVFAFTGVNVIPMDREEVLFGQSILISDGRISAVGPDGTIQIPPTATVASDCRGFLMPGLTDMHVHTLSADLDDYVASGITSVRHMWGYPAIQQLAEEIEHGERIGPSIYAISPGLDGNPPKWPFTQIILDPDLADSVVQAQVDAGWTTLKLYQDLSLSVYDAIVDAAKARGLEYVGHVPHRVGLPHALESGQRSIEHLSGYELALNGGSVRGAFGWLSIDDDLIPGLVSMTLDAGTWNCPTLAIFSLIASGDETVVENRRRMVKALHDAGARLLIGTDAGIGVTQPGISIHQEIAEFVAAGLSPYEALRGATIDAAEFLRTGFGVVEAGAVADLVMLAGNPLEDVSHAREPVFVMLRGTVVRN